MSKKTGLYLMLAGVALSVYDLASGGGLYGTGKPAEKLRWKVYTSGTGATAKDWYVSASDLAAIAGAVIYFK